MMFRRCEDCGSQLDACPAKLRADGEQTFVGFYPCPCNEAREEDAERDEWKNSDAWVTSAEVANG